MGVVVQKYLEGTSLEKDALTSLLCPRDFLLVNGSGLQPYFGLLLFQILGYLWQKTEGGHPRKSMNISSSPTPPASALEM